MQDLGMETSRQADGQGKASAASAGPDQGPAGGEQAGGAWEGPDRVGIRLRAWVFPKALCKPCAHRAPSSNSRCPAPGSRGKLLLLVLPMEPGRQGKDTEVTPVLCLSSLQ